MPPTWGVGRACRLRCRSGCAMTFRRSPIILALRQTKSVIATATSKSNTDIPGRGVSMKTPIAALFSTALASQYQQLTRDLMVVPAPNFRMPQFILAEFEVAADSSQVFVSKSPAGAFAQRCRSPEPLRPGCTGTLGACVVTVARMPQILQFSGVIWSRRETYIYHSRGVLDAVSGRQSFNLVRAPCPGPT